MPRALAIDYGKKRCGIAVTDPLNIIATALDTVATKDLVDYVIRYCSEEEVNHIILGKPMHRDGNPVELYQDIVGCKAKLKRHCLILSFMRRMSALLLKWRHKLWC